MKALHRHSTLAIALGLFPPLLWAHPLHGTSTLEGFLHPLTGADHLLAMLGIGLWASQQQGRARWTIPASFVALMGLGALAGFSAQMPSFVESGIVVSLLLLGAFIGIALRPSGLLGAMLAGVFAIFHGYAHGAEMPASADAWKFGVGFLLAAALLHATGFLAGNRMNKVMIKAGGTAILAFGGMLLLQGLR
ncbi:HupE/UreJ family protein [Noviherbaspirillum massiliense]|uniref:HupE/UreJ family protein n=1 Tax=Noviherbaspirillum massiliense TaxID=1465823 RepID=UPI000314E4F8|nr:HupE/UreJ family protein [Noviherbaspirillum massiliense]